MEYRDDKQRHAERYLARAGYPTGNDVQALGPKPDFSAAQKFTNESVWTDAEKSLPKK